MKNQILLTSSGNGVKPDLEFTNDIVFTSFRRVQVSLVMI